MRTWEAGNSLFSMKCAIRSVKVSVLPVPGPARMRRRRLSLVTAAIWAAFNSILEMLLGGVSAGGRFLGLGVEVDPFRPPGIGVFLAQALEQLAGVWRLEVHQVLHRPGGAFEELVHQGLAGAPAHPF